MKVTFYYHAPFVLYDTPESEEDGRFHFFKDAGNWFLVDSDFRPSTKVEQVSEELALDLHEAAKNEEDVTVDL